MSSKVTTLAMGLTATVGVIVLQIILPFAFDFVSDLALFGVGIYTGKALAAAE